MTDIHKNTHKCTNEVRFPISFGMFPVILFSCKYLNMRNNKNVMMIFLQNSLFLHKLRMCKILYIIQNT